MREEEKANQGYSLTSDGSADVHAWDQAIADDVILKDNFVIDIELAVTMSMFTCSFISSMTSLDANNSD